MLSTITPLAESGRGRRFATTARWYVVGSIAGGLTLGGGMALLAAAIANVSVSRGTVLWAVAIASILAAASDGRLGGFQLPGHDRQVNEMWLERYRSWVYGTGFGWQIGVGLATYIMTGGLYLMILMATISGQPWWAVAAGLVFGLIRGAAVYLARSLDLPEAVLSFHRRFEALRQPTRRAMILVLTLVALLAISVTGSTAWLRLGAAIVALAVAAAGVWTDREPSYVLVGRSSAA
jgi:hypothetical protein